MKVASVRDLRNTYNELLRQVEAGEEVVIQRRGKPVARLIPEPVRATEVDWSQSAALRRDKSKWPPLGQGEVREVLGESSGRW